MEYKQYHEHEMTILLLPPGHISFKKRKGRRKDIRSNSISRT
jgi:hypothetical protein